MPRQPKPDIKLSEAADKATALLQGLQSRLNGNGAVPSSDPNIDTREESPEVEIPDDLDRQLQEYFVAASEKTPPEEIPYNETPLKETPLKETPLKETPDDTDLPDKMRERVIDAVADRILESWDLSGKLEYQVIDRLAQRILERMTRR